MKILTIIVIFTLLQSCTHTKKVSTPCPSTYSMGGIVNKEIIDGFFEGDTTGISHQYFFLENF